MKQNKYLIQLIRALEVEIMAVTIRNIRSNLLSKDEANNIIKDFQAVLPIESEADLFYKLYRLGNMHLEIKEIYAKYKALYIKEKLESSLPIASKVSFGHAQVLN